MKSKVLFVFSFFLTMVAYSQQVSFIDSVATENFVSKIMQESGIVNPIYKIDSKKKSLRYDYQNGDKRFQVLFWRYDDSLRLSDIQGSYDEVFYIWKKYCDPDADKMEVKKKTSGKVIQLYPSPKYYYVIAINGKEDYWHIFFRKYDQNR